MKGALDPNPDERSDSVQARQRELESSVEAAEATAAQEIAEVKLRASREVASVQELATKEIGRLIETVSESPVGPIPLSPDPLKESQNLQTEEEHWQPPTPKNVSQEVLCAECGWGKENSEAICDRCGIGTPSPLGGRVHLEGPGGSDRTCAVPVWGGLFGYVKTPDSGAKTGHPPKPIS